MCVAEQYKKVEKVQKLKHRVLEKKQFSKRNFDKT